MFKLHHFCFKWCYKTTIYWCSLREKVKIMVFRLSFEELTTWAPQKMVMKQNVTFASISFQLNFLSNFLLFLFYLYLTWYISQIFKLQNHEILNLLSKVYICNFWNVHTVYTEFWTCPTHLSKQMTPRDLRNVHTTENGCRDALSCANRALKLP